MSSGIDTMGEVPLVQPELGGDDTFTGLSIGDLAQYVDCVCGGLVGVGIPGISRLLGICTTSGMEAGLLGQDASRSHLVFRFSSVTD